MTTATTTKNPSRLKKWGINIALMLISIAVTIGAIALISPELFNRALALIIPAETIKFYVGMGDLFIAQPNTIAPPDDPNAILDEYLLKWDEDGFRVPQNPSDDYRVIALGDSFTEAPNVGTPWTDILAEKSGFSVRNMGFRGYGPVEEALVMKEYEADTTADYVIIAFFEGNDISNAQSYTWQYTAENPFELPHIARQAMREDPRQVLLWTFEQPQGDNFKYPVMLTLNGTSQPMAFLEGYIWNNVVSAEVLEASRPVEMTRQSWRDIQAVSADACVILAYLPSKETIYLPYVGDEADVAKIFDNPMHLILSDVGFLSVVKDPEGSYQKWAEGRTVIRDTIEKYTAMDGIAFVDLTPHFEERASAGDVLFYVYDTHPNQQGHDLIGSVLADAIKTNPCGNGQS
ncbi:MAG: SGNH/GDSL hydrolase family protein [bacterium]|nr:SGNH/GDSL hydrolase family protein [bacterium]